MFRLLNFDLKVSGDENAGYTVDAIDPNREPATAPFDRASVEALVPDLVAIERGAADREMLERVGRTLAQALFSQEVRDLYLEVQARLGPDEGLRLRLCLPPQLSRLPWELLFFRSHFLTLNSRRTVVRFFDLPGRPRPLAVRPPLRLLHLIANPVETPALDVERERRELNSALADLSRKGWVEILPCPAGTLAALQDCLRDGCHFLHFSGHGAFEGGRGYLLFEDDDGRAQRVDGDTLAVLLQASDVRVAILNACESGKAGAGDAFGSVAAALIRADLPAVIAHQYALPDRSAIPFAAEFYRALADGYPVDAAVSEGRKAVLIKLGSAWRDSVDWATPVLFMRPPDGRILAFEEKTKRASPDESPGPAGARYVTDADSPDAAGYNLAEIRKLLTAAFTPQDLRRFCQDRPLFRPVISRFGPGQGLDDMVAEVVDFCESKFLWAEFLAAVKAENPRQYKRYEPRLFSAPPASQPASAAAPLLPADPLPNLLSELRDAVRDLAPEEKRPQALEKMATLRGAATERRPNLALMESVWQWFDAELPALSGAVLSAILGAKPKLEELGDDYLLLEFRRRFEEPF